MMPGHFDYLVMCIVELILYFQNTSVSEIVKKIYILSKMLQLLNAL